MFKKVLLVVGVLALLVSITLAGIWVWGQATAPAMAQTSTTTASSYNPAQTIIVVGQGTFRSEPDVAQVSIGVETSAETVSEAVAQNEAQMTSILAALTEIGIAEKDIQTMNYSIQFERYPEPAPRVSGTESDQATPQYRVSNMANVTIRDLDKVGDVLDAVVAAGANNIWGVSFSLEDPEPGRAEARSKAVADAQARAEALAELGGVTLGPIMSMSEVISGGGVPVTAMAFERAVSGGGPISPGEVEVNYQLQVTYFIEP